MNPLIIKVLQKHIKKGLVGEKEFCPICCALHDKDILDVEVDMDPMLPVWELKVNGLYYDLPGEAQRFCQEFDSGLEVEPITFKTWLREEDDDA